MAVIPFVSWKPEMLSSCLFLDQHPTNHPHVGQDDESLFLSTDTLYFDHITQTRTGSEEIAKPRGSHFLHRTEHQQQQDVSPVTSKSQSFHKNEESRHDYLIDQNTSHRVSFDNRKSNFFHTVGKNDNSFLQKEILSQQSIQDHHEDTRETPKKSPDTAKIYRGLNRNLHCSDKEHESHLETSSSSCSSLSFGASSFDETGTSNTNSMADGEEDIKDYYYSPESNYLMISVARKGNHGGSYDNNNNSGKCIKCQEREKLQVMMMMMPEQGIHSNCSCHHNQRGQFNERGINRRKTLEAKAGRERKHELLKTDSTTSSSDASSTDVLCPDCEMEQQETKKQEALNQEMDETVSSVVQERNFLSQSKLRSQDRESLTASSLLASPCLSVIFRPVTPVSGDNASMVSDDSVAPRVRRKGILRPPTDYTLMMTRKTIRMRMREEEESGETHKRKVSWGVNETFEIVRDEEEASSVVPAGEDIQERNVFLSLLVSLLNASQDQQKGRTFQKVRDPRRSSSVSSSLKTANLFTQDLLLSSPSSSSSSSSSSLSPSSPDDMFLFASLGCLFLLASGIPFIINVLSHTV